MAMRVMPEAEIGDDEVGRAWLVVQQRTPYIIGHTTEGEPVKAAEPTSPSSDTLATLAQPGQPKGPSVRLKVAAARAEGY
jgi:hypothetical protein